MRFQLAGLHRAYTEADFTGLLVNQQAMDTKFHYLISIITKAIEIINNDGILEAEKDASRLSAYFRYRNAKIYRLFDAILETTRCKLF